jgi:hypothetical protein
MSDVVRALDAGLIHWLLDNGMAPMALSGLKHIDHSIEAELLQKLTAVSLSARFESAARADALDEVLKAMPASRGIGLLKGMLFAHDFYAEPHFRPMGDIDLLVADSDTAQISELLLNLGYVNRAIEPQEYFETHHHLMPFYHDGKKVCIEVHTGLFPTRSGLAGRGPFDPANLQANLRDTSFRGMPIKALNYELQLLHTAAHWAEEFRRVGGILGIMDTSMLMAREQTNLNWDWIFAHGENAAHIAPIQLMLGYLERAELCALPGDVKKSLRRRGKLCPTALRIQFEILDRLVVLGRKPGAILSDSNLLTSWKMLLHSGNNELVLAKLLWNIAFPQEAENRYRLDYQIGRLKNLKSRL